jgi:ABC-type sugar transport system permease subunit
MSETVMSGRGSTESNENFLIYLSVWHGVVAVAVLAGILWLWVGGNSMATWLKIVATAIMIPMGIASGFAIPAIQKRQHRGRMLSLAVNYIGFLVSLLLTLHYFGVFLGVDVLSDTFGRGILFLLLVLIGFLMRTGENKTVAEIGKWLMVVGGVLFLLRVGLIAGILTFFSQLNTPLNIALFVATALFGSMTWLMWRNKAAGIMGETKLDDETINGYLFLSPNLLGFLLFFAGPLLFSLYVSFTDSDAFGDQNFIGLSNYAEILNLDFATLDTPDQPANEALDITVFDELTRFNLFGKSYVLGAEDKLFWTALGNTLMFVLMAVPLSILPALFLSSVLNSKIPGMNFFRTIYFLPSIAAVVGVSLIWRWLYNSTVGWLNYIIAIVAGALNLTINTEIGWLSDTNIALFSVVIIAAWQWMGYNTILYLAGLQNIPNSLYEAATVDGAGPVTQFFRITVPLLAPTTFFVVITTTIQAMQIFDQVFVLTNPPGGPGTSTMTIVLYLYNQGFRNFRQGYASALAWVLFLLIFGLTLLQFQRQRNNPDEA